MKWKGIVIKEFLIQRKMTAISLAQKVGVTRQMLSKWIGGSTPSGKYIMRLCEIFDVMPDVFFDQESKPVVSVPVHRTHKRAKLTEEMQDIACQIREPYIDIFSYRETSVVIPAIDANFYTDESALSVAKQLSDFWGLDSTMPITFENNLIFRILSKIGIYVILVSFPDKFKSVAFYQAINNNKLVFIDTNLNILDLIFHLLHESIHSLMSTNTEENKVIDSYCDLVASYLQFPVHYVSRIYKMIKDDVNNNNVEKVMSTLHKVSLENHHCIYGIARRLVNQNLLDKDYLALSAKMDMQLQKKVKTLSEIIEESNDPNEYITLYKSISPRFIDLIQSEIDELSDDKIKEIFQLPSAVDGHIMHNALRNVK